MLIDEPDDHRDFLECSHCSLERSPVRRRRAEAEAAQLVRLVLLLLVGPREGENEVLEFASVEDAVAYGRQLCEDSQFQLEGIEDANGSPVIGYDFLNDLCRAPFARRRRHG